MTIGYSAGETALAWAGAVVIVLWLVVAASDIAGKLRRAFGAVTDKSPSVENDVKIVMANVRVNNDPTKPDSEIYPAIHEAIKPHRGHRGRR